MFLISLAINVLSELKENSLKFMSMINQKCMSRPKFINLNSDEPVFYPLSISINKCSGSCNSINDPYAKLCVPNITKSINIKVFNTMSRINEAKQILWHETCKCVCRLTTAVCNTKQIWNENKCKCEWKEDLITKITCDKEYIRNPSTCECECDKLCNIGQYLDYKNCVCKKNIADRLVEECVNIVDEDIMYNRTLSIDPNDPNERIRLMLHCLLYFY